MKAYSPVPGPQQEPQTHSLNFLYSDIVTRPERTL